MIFYWKEMQRRTRAAQALAMLHDSMDRDGINQANAILDELCLDRSGAERLIRSRMPRRPSLTESPSPTTSSNVGVQYFKPPPHYAEQSKRFIEKAREIGADEDESAAIELLRRLAKKPHEPRRKDNA